MWKRYHWIKNVSILLFICLFSYITAKIGSTYVLAYLTKSKPEIIQPGKTRPPAGKRTRKKGTYHYRPIAQKNIFNSAYTGQSESTKSIKSSDPKPLAKLNVKLLGTVVGDPESSFAIIEDHQSRKQELFQINDMIQDVARVLAISRCEVVVLREGAEEILKCPEPDDKNDKKKTSPVRYSDASAGVPGGGIKKVSDTDYLIDEAEVENALNNINMLMTQVRVVPNFQDGQANGFKVFAIKPQSIFAQIGLKNGDVIKSINDQDITTPDKAFKAFQEMRNEKSFSVNISRRGQQKSLHYDIR